MNFRLNANPNEELYHQRLSIARELANRGWTFSEWTWTELTTIEINLVAADERLSIPQSAIYAKHS